MTGFALFLAVMVTGGSRPAAPPPKVEAVLATRVRFEGAAAVRIADLGLAMLAESRYEGVPNEGNLPSWEDLSDDVRNRTCHIHIAFERPKTVHTIISGPVEVSEMFVVLPLHQGHLWVRAGDGSRRVAKWSAGYPARIQALLKEAVPVP
jgi:hypothetical protein